MKKKSPFVFLFAKSDRTMTSGWQGAPYFRSYGRELVSKSAISLIKKSGGGYLSQNESPAKNKTRPPVIGHITTICT